MYIYFQSLGKTAIPKLMKWKLWQMSMAKKSVVYSQYNPVKQSN
jgi:hypothetical protein